MSIADIRKAMDANQRRASDPRVSAWVSANAGTGKTTVLVNRVLRLLLEGPAPDDADGHGVAPERILCLTYTKNAAAEMENRLFASLAEWTAMEDAALATALRDLTGRPPEPPDLARARHLFATVLETPGGLKIHTVHAFCERLLQRFPVEAGVPAGFTVLDEIEQRALRDAAVAEVLDEAVHDPTGRYGPALMQAVACAAEESFRTCIDAMLAKREDLRRIALGAADVARLAEGEALALRDLLGVRKGASEESLRDEMAAVLDDAALDAAAAALDSGSTADVNRAEDLRSARAAASRERRIAALARALLTQAGAPRRTVCTKATGEAHPGIAARLAEARDRLHALDLELTAVRAASASGALLTLADAVLGAYSRLKQARAALDYDDLIEKAESLLTRSGAAAWVLYKLDGGIDHILVDEAQDTSPPQWRVIAALADEFFAGSGARAPSRTLFAVGDEKQSIYSFQGAEPAAFGAQGRAFERRARDAGLTWQRVPLTLSFRSAETVLDCVDAVFAQSHAADGLTWDGAEVVHYAHRLGQPGLVEIWPIERPEPRVETDAFDLLNAQEPARQAAETVAARVADRIADWLNEGAVLESSGRPIRAGDVLILVRKRAPFTRPMIRALKTRGIPVAGADRMILTAQIAVMDLMALGDFLLMPADDLALATVLKSPLFGLDDDDLFALAYRRPGALWRALKSKAAEKPGYGAAVERLEAWLARTDYAAPYEFYAGILEEHGMAMRRRLLARLGPDAGDAIDEFLNQALIYDAAAPPSLQGFLDRVRRANIEVKRDMEQGRDEVRVMTVHGAKGLEAPIVILPDTCAAPSSGSRSPVLSMPPASASRSAPARLLWALPGAGRLDAVEAAKDAMRRAERAEHNRLLYVAMTRARDRLYVCGWEGRNSRSEGVWYDLVDKGIAPLVETVADGPDRGVRRYRSGDLTVPVVSAQTQDAAPRAPPDWAGRPARQEAPAVRPLTPSALHAPSQGEGDSARAQETASPRVLAHTRRFRRGEIVHGLLQLLPVLNRDRWQEAATAYAAKRGADLSESERADIVGETLAVLRDPDSASLFGPDSLGEVPILARLGNGTQPVEIAGQVDRLSVGTDTVRIVDYKTNRPPPDTPQDVAPAYLAQLAAYRAALRQLYPDRSILCALLWTAAPRLMRVPDRLLDAHAPHATGGDRLP